ncbi:D-alanyl-D-alanine carboxypeptidase/D-alanyl-D-alanine-endopeptidase [Nocardioides sp.]|uniref:D-alanyl-D-alanine carboxypeptidase/D-alanyl-D-alanine endopeptidase n=1 Tax=Nocardioides sp. TaxID=35761 RepID=UPI0039E2B183
MARDRRHSRLRWLAPVLTIVMLAAVAATGWRLGWIEEWLEPAPATVTTSPPEPWETPVPSPTAVAPEAGTTAPDPALVAAAMTPALQDGSLGGRVVAEVAPAEGGAPVFETGAGAAVPASLTKLLTSTAALATLGPERTFATTVVQPDPGTIVLVGGGDPLLASRPDKDLWPARADLRTLARATADQLAKQGVGQVALGYDDSLFAGPTHSVHWPASYAAENVVAPITALWADRGYDESGRAVADPSRAAADVFATYLAKRGIEVTGEPSAATGSGGTLAEVESPPLREIVQHLVSTSDNEVAEVVGRQVGVAAGDPTFEGAAAAILQADAGVGVPVDGVELYDASGLARDNRITPEALTAVLQHASQPGFDAILTGLPVAGFSGSLIARFTDEASQAGLGVARLKTGTLTGVHGVAGVVTDADGTAMTLVVMADAVGADQSLAARQALDDAAAALAACHCS